MTTLTSPCVCLTLLFAPTCYNVELSLDLSQSGPIIRTRVSRSPLAIKKDATLDRVALLTIRTKNTVSCILVL